MKINGNYINQYLNNYRTVNPFAAKGSQNSEQVQLFAPKKDVMLISANEPPTEQEQKDFLAELEERYQKQQALMDQMKSETDRGNAENEALKIRMNCLIIAMRIMSGDEVPAADYRYLAKHDPELYGKAVIMRTPKENPKKYKQLSPDEDKQLIEEVLDYILKEKSPETKPLIPLSVTAAESARLFGNLGNLGNFEGFKIFENFEI